MHLTPIIRPEWSAHTPASPLHGKVAPAALAKQHQPAVLAGGFPLAFRGSSRIQGIAKGQPSWGDTLWSSCEEVLKSSSRQV